LESSSSDVNYRN